MLLQTDSLSALETRIAVARSYVCSQRTEFEGLVSGWHYRFESAMAAGTLELQQALSTRAELNTLLYETGSARTLSLARNSAGLYWIGSIMAFYRRSVSPWLRGLYPFKDIHFV